MKDNLIDGQILLLHRAMADKLLANPDKVIEIREKMEQQLQHGQLGYGAYISWCSALELIYDPVLFRSTLLEDSHTMRKLRRRTVLTGLLNEEERQQALQSTTAGQTSIEAML